MALSGTAKALFDACAKAIVNHDIDSDLNLFPLTREHGSMSDEAVEYLAGEVEAASNGRQTIRRADVALFARHIQGQNLYLVLCDSSAPPGNVTELASSMTLVSLGPYSKGLFVDAERATPERVQEYREFVARINREREERQQDEKDAETFVTWLASLLSQHASARGNTELAEWLTSRSSISLEDLAGACRKLNLSLQRLIQEA